MVRFPSITFIHTQCDSIYPQFGFQWSNSIMNDTVSTTTHTFWDIQFFYTVVNRRICQLFVAETILLHIIPRPQVNNLFMRPGGFRKKVSTASSFRHPPRSSTLFTSNYQQTGPSGGRCHCLQILPNSSPGLNRVLPHFNFTLMKDRCAWKTIFFRWRDSEKTLRPAPFSPGATPNTPSSLAFRTVQLRGSRPPF